MVERVCQKSLILGNRVHKYKYYDRIYDIKQCNNCGKLGHFQVYCWKELHCRKYHASHNNECPQFAPTRCVLYNSTSHSAFYQRCPRIQAEKARLNQIKRKNQIRRRETVEIVRNNSSISTQLTTSMLSTPSTQASTPASTQAST